MGVPEATTFLSREDTSQMRLLHDLAKIHATFDDPNLVSRAGLVPVMALACRAGGPGGAGGGACADLPAVRDPGTVHAGVVPALVHVGSARRRQRRPWAEVVRGQKGKLCSARHRELTEGGVKAGSRLRGPLLLLREPPEAALPRVEEAWSHSVRSPPSRAFHQGRRGTVALRSSPSATATRCRAPMPWSSRCGLPR